MITFETTLLKFDQHGDKTGWTYIYVPADLAQQLKPGNKKSFRVKGKFDEYAIAGVAMLPAGDGGFMIAFNAAMRKGTRKNADAVITVQLEPHNDFKIEIPPDLKECFGYEEPAALQFFEDLPRGHRDYFINWINSAKTQTTRAVRIANTINAATRRMWYPEMIRDIKARK